MPIGVNCRSLIRHTSIFFTTFTSVINGFSPTPWMIITIFSFASCLPNTIHSSVPFIGIVSASPNRTNSTDTTSLTTCAVDPLSASMTLSSRFVVFTSFDPAIPANNNLTADKSLNLTCLMFCPPSSFLLLRICHFHFHAVPWGYLVSCCPLDLLIPLMDYVLVPIHFHYRYC